MIFTMMHYRLWGLPLVSLAFAIAGCSQQQAPVTSDSPSSPISAAAAPANDRSTTPDSATKEVADDQVAVQLLDWDGLNQLLASHRGKVVVLDCWSTSCAPCIKEFPNLVALQNAHDRDDLACVSLSFDYEGIGRPEDQEERVLDFLRKQQANFDNVLSTLDSDALTAKLDIPSIPAVFVYDREGKLHQRFDNRQASKSGPFTYEQVNQVVEELLAKPAG
jgi:thiol-disulfide isomerase/thioredoxin